MTESTQRFVRRDQGGAGMLLQLVAMRSGLSRSAVSPLSTGRASRILLRGVVVWVPEERRPPGEQLCSNPDAQSGFRACREPQRRAWPL